MQFLNQLKIMFNHMHWADAKNWDTLLSLKAANKDEKLKLILYHLHLVQYGFYYIWLNLPLEFPKESEFKNLRKLAVWASEYHGLLNSYLSEINEKDLKRIIKIPWSNQIEKAIGKKPSETTLAETMIQVTLHTSHHRGQVCSRIRELNGEPPLIDFIAWLWQGKPEAVWPVTDIK